MVPCTMDGSGAGPRLSSIRVGRDGQSTPEAGVGARLSLHVLSVLPSAANTALL